MSGDEKRNILIHGKPTGTIELRPHPEDVIDVDPEILAVMNARLRGDSFEQMYGKEDRVSKEFLIQLERKKLGRVFGSPTQLTDAFSSLKNIKTVRQELGFESVNREILAEYTAKQSNGEPVDEVDAYRTVLFGDDLRSKRERLKVWATADMRLSAEVRDVFALLAESYRETHFDVIGVSKELLQLQKPLRDLLHGGKLLPAVDEILVAFYGEGA